MRFLTPWLKEQGIHISNALLSTHGLKTREKFWPSIYLAWNDLNIQWSRMSRKLRPQTQKLIQCNPQSGKLRSRKLRPPPPKTVTQKVNLRSLKLHHDYSNSLTLSNVGELITTISIASSRRSDSGERCEVKRSAKNKNKGVPPLLFIAFLYFAPLPGQYLNTWNRPPYLSPERERKMPHLFTLSTT